MVSASLLVAFAILGLVVLLRRCQRHHALRHFGGHWSAGWSRLWLLKSQGSGEMNKIFSAINEKYGEPPASSPSPFAPNALRTYAFVKRSHVLHPLCPSVLPPTRAGVTLRLIIFPNDVLAHCAIEMAPPNMQCLRLARALAYVWPRYNRAHWTCDAHHLRP